MNTKKRYVLSNFLLPSLARLAAASPISMHANVPPLVRQHKEPSPHHDDY
jgi:hypothetical protein